VFWCGAFLYDSALDRPKTECRSKVTDIKLIRIRNSVRQSGAGVGLSLGVGLVPSSGPMPEVGLAPGSPLVPGEGDGLNSPGGVGPALTPIPSACDLPTESRTCGFC